MSLEAGQYQFCFRKQNCLRAQTIGRFSMPNLKICHAGMTISLRKESQTLPTAALETSRDASSFDRSKPESPVAGHVLSYALKDELRPFFNFTAHA